MKFQQRLTHLLFILGLFFIWSCSDSEEISPEESFTKIYDDGEFGGSFFPIDLQQTTDGGYLIVGEYEVEDSDFYGLYLLKTDPNGNFMWDYRDQGNFVSPSAAFKGADSSVFVVCMDKLSLGTYVLRVNGSDSASAPSIVQNFGDVLYPLASSQVPDGYLVQSYDRIARATELVKLDASFNISWTSPGYNVLEDSEELLIDHLTRRGQRLPFFTGHVGDATSASRYFLNGFNNFTMSTLFVNTTDGGDVGLLNGVRYKDAVSALVPLTGNSFTISMFKEGSNFFGPSTEINTTAGVVASIGDIAGNEISELSENANVIGKKITFGQKEVVILASDTKGNQIVLYSYDAESGELLGTQYLGFSNPYEVANFIATPDGGLAILGTTFILGRFPRITLFKLSSLDIEGLTGA